MILSKQFTLKTRIIHWQHRLYIMENQTNLESGFQIKNLILIESIFNRISNVSFGDGIANNLNINVQVGVIDNSINVEEEVLLEQKFQDKIQVTIKVKMVGIFEKIGDSHIGDLEEFGKINGAAIIFPFIREIITNLSLKGGIGPIILSPVNFSKLQDPKQ